MDRTSLTRFQYIQYLVYKIKDLHKLNKNYDFYFNELIKMYSPLINMVSKNVQKKYQINITFTEIKTKVIELVFLALIRFDIEYNDRKEDVKGFDTVYFSKYLKNTLPWEVLRIIRPNKVEYDEYATDPKFKEFDVNKLPKKIKEKLIHNEVANHPISDNFINLCRLMKNELKSDLLGDIMMLNFGYAYKNHEISKILGISQARVGVCVLQIKNFWKENKDLLING